ncbi:hypothetical protein COBT_000300 [Conglomerata obtusa]
MGTKQTSLPLSGNEDSDKQTKKPVINENKNFDATRTDILNSVICKIFNLLSDQNTNPIKPTPGQRNGLIQIMNKMNDVTYNINFNSDTIHNGKSSDEKHFGSD